MSNKCFSCEAQSNVYLVFGGIVMCQACYDYHTKLYVEDQNKLLTELLDPKFLPEKV